MGLDRDYRLDNELNRLLDDLSRPDREHDSDIPGKRTRVQQLAEQLTAQTRGPGAATAGPGRRTLVERLLSMSTKLSFDDYRVVALKDTLAALGGQTKLRDATAAAADPEIAERAVSGPQPAESSARGAAIWRASERHAATLYRHAFDAGEAAADDPAVVEALARAGRGASLPAAVRRKMEGEFGVSLERVRVHTDGVAARAARAVRAEAFTVGEDIFFADGAYAPDSRAGQKLLAHEIAHVVQGWQGRGDSAGAGRVSQPGDSLEQEADAVAEKVDDAHEDSGKRGKREGRGGATGERIDRQLLGGAELGGAPAAPPPIGANPAADKPAGASEPAPSEATSLGAESAETTEGGGAPGGPAFAAAGAGVPPSGGGAGGGAGAGTGAASAKRTVHRKATGRPAPTSSTPGAIQPTLKRVTKRSPGKVANPAQNARGQFAAQLGNTSQATKGHLSGLKSEVKSAKQAPVGKKSKEQGKQDKKKAHDNKHAADAHAKHHKALAEEHKNAKHHGEHDGGAEVKCDPHAPIQFKKVDDWNRYMPQPMPDQDARERARILRLVKNKVEGERAASQKALSTLHAAQIKQAAAIRKLKPGLQSKISSTQTAALGQVASAESAQAAAVAAAFAAAKGQVNGAASAAKGKVNGAYADAVAAINEAYQAADQKLTDGQNKANTDIGTAESAQIIAVGAAYSGARAKVDAAGAAEASHASGLANSVSLPYDGEKLEAATKAAHDTAEGWAKEIPGKMQEEAEKNIYSNQPETEKGVHDLATHQKEGVKTVYDQLKKTLDTAHEQALQGAQTARSEALSQIDQIAASTCASLSAQSAAQVAAVHQQASATRAGIIKAGQAAQAQVAEACDKAAVGLESGAHGLVKGAKLVEAPNPEDTATKVKEGGNQLRTAATSITDGLKKQADQSAQGLTQQSAAAAKGMADIANGARQSSAQIAQGASASITQAGAGAAKSLTAMGESFDKQAKSISDGGDTAFQGIVTDLGKAYQEATTNLIKGIDDGVEGLKKGFHDAIEDKERAAIAENAKKAADAVKPWWQKALAFVLVIVVAIVITVMVTALTGGLGTGPVMIALIAIGSGALAGGLSSAAGQVVNNLVMGKGPFEDFSWKEVGIGALAGGLTAGMASGVTAIGGATVKAAMGGAAGFSNVAIRTGVNFATGMGADALAQLAINGKYEFSMQNMITTLGFSAVMSTNKFLDAQNRIGDNIRVKFGMDPIHVASPAVEGGAHPTEGGTSGGPKGGAEPTAPGGGEHGPGTSAKGGGAKPGEGGGAKPGEGGGAKPGEGGKPADTVETKPGGSKPGDEGGARPTTDEHGGKPGGAKPGEEGGGRPTTDEHGGKPGDKPGTKPGDEHGGKPAGDEQGGKPAGDEQGGKPAGDEHGGKPAGDEQGGKPAGDEHGGKPAGDEHGGKPGEEGAKGKGDEHGKGEDGKPGDKGKGDEHGGKPGDEGAKGKGDEGGKGGGDEHGGKPNEKGKGDEGGRSDEQKAHDEARDAELREDGYPEGTRENADKTASDIEAGKKPKEDGLRDTEANSRGREELEKMLKDPKLTPEERVRIERELAEKLRSETDPTGNLERDLGEARTKVENEKKPGDTTAETKPGDTTAETKPGETRPGETKPGETKPGDTTAETKPGETKPGESKTGETKPGEAPEVKPPEAGLKDSKITDRFAGEMKTLEAKWGSMSPQERTAAIRDILNAKLREAGLPELKVKTEPLGDSTNGHLDFQDWAVTLNEGKINSPKMDQAKLGELTNTVLHEARHGEQWYMMARHMAESGMTPPEIAARTGMPEPIAAKAAGEPKMSPQQAADAAKYYDSVYGTNSAHRNQVLNDLKRLPAEVERARLEYKAVENDPRVSQAERDAKFKAWEDAYNKAQQNYNDYRNLPEEADAWATGDAAEASFKNTPKPEVAPDASTTQPLPKTDPNGGLKPPKMEPPTRPEPGRPEGTRPEANGKPGEPIAEVPPDVKPIGEAPTRAKTRGTPEDQLSPTGINDPVPLTAKERAAIEQYQSERNQYLERWRGEPDSTMPRETQELVWGKADRAIRKNMTPDDLAAVVKEGRGVEILKEDGTPFQHGEEYRGARNSVVNTMEKIKARLRGFSEHGGAKPGEVELLNRKLGDLSRLLDSYEGVGGLPKAQPTETAAPKTEPTTDAPEVKAPETKPPANENKAPETKTDAPETKAPEGKAPTEKPPELEKPRMAADDWVAHLKSQLDEGALVRFEQVAEGKTPQEIMDRFNGDFDAAGTELGAKGAPHTPDTADRFTVGELPKAGSARWKYLEDPAHWTPERAALHDRLIENAKAQARQFAETLSGKEPTLFAMRGNTAAGKTRAVTGNVEELAGPMAQTKDLPHRSVNPDNFKADLIKETPGATSSDVHSESSMLAGRLESELVGMRTSDGQPASILIDKRLPSVDDVQGYAKMAKESGRKFVLFDVDAPLEESLAGVLGRMPGGADPLPPFDIVAGGFKAVRENRLAVRDLFSDPSFGTYHLYGTKPSGERIEIAVVENGKVNIKNQELYDIAMEPPEVSLATTRITRDTIDAMTKNLPPERAAQVRAILEKYEGYTWKAALDAHSREKPP